MRPQHRVEGASSEARSCHHPPSRCVDDSGELWPAPHSQLHNTPPSEAEGKEGT